MVIVVVDVNYSVARDSVFDDYVLVIIVNVVLRIMGYFVYGRRRRGCYEPLTFGFVCGCCEGLLLVKGVINVV